MYVPISFKSDLGTAPKWSKFVGHHQHFGVDHRSDLNQVEI